MRASKTNLAAKLLAAGLLLASALSTAPAWAGAGVIRTTVTPLLAPPASPQLYPSVTYSSAVFDSWIGYEVTVLSDPTNTNTSNHVQFTGTVLATDPAEKATFVAAYWKGADGTPPCTASPDGASINCEIGTLRAGDTFPTFVLFFKVPAQVVISNDPKPDDNLGSDFLTFSGITSFSESSVSQPPVTNSAPPWSPAVVLLGTSNPTEVRLSIPKKGSTFVTGTGVTTGSDQFATAVTVPAAGFYTGDASIYESTFVTGCVNFVPCWSSVVSIPDRSFDYLTIVLRQDKSTIKAGTKIESVQIWYDGSDTTGDSFHGYLGLCPSPTTPLSDRPCIAERKYYKSKSVPGWTPNLDGDFEWTAITNKNGGYRIE